MTGSLAMPMESVLAPAGGRRPMQRVGVVAVAALSLLVLQTWTPESLDSLRRQSHGPETHGAAAPAEGLPAVPVALQVSPAKAEEVTHGILPVAGRSGDFEVHDASYRARFDAAGFSYTPTGAAAGVGVTLSSIERGGDALALRTGAWTVDSNVAQRPVAAEVREMVTAREGEIEWDVVLDAAPAGRGDLTVGARLDGLAGVPTRVPTDDGPAWRLGLAGGESVLIDEVVVLDAHGTPLHRALPTISGSSVELVVPGAVLDRAAYPLVVDPTIGTEYYVAGTNAFFTISRPSIATAPNGTSLGAFQVDPAPTSQHFPSSIRIIDSGRDFIEAGIEPDVAWTGTNFVVVWARNGRIRGCYAAVPLASPASHGCSTPFDIAPAPFNTDTQGSPAVVGLGGGNAFVVWENGNNVSNPSIYGAAMDPDGRALPLGGTKIAGSGDVYSLDNPDVAVNTGRPGSPATVLVAWHRMYFDFATVTDTIQARQMTPSGVALGTGPIHVTDTTRFAENPAVASDGSDFFVVWDDGAQRGTGSSKNIRGARVSRSGARIGAANGFIVSDAEGPQTFPAVAYNGNYLVAWADRRFPDSDVYFNRVTAGGNVKEGTGLKVSGKLNIDEDFPTVAALGYDSQNAQPASFVVGYESIGDPIPGTSGDSNADILARVVRVEVSPK